jgi:nucleoid DNA-binding protein
MVDTFLALRPEWQIKTRAEREIGGPKTKKEARLMERRAFEFVTD